MVGQEAKSCGQESKAVRFTGKQMMQSSQRQAGSADKQHVLMLVVGEGGQAGLQGIRKRRQVRNKQDWNRAGRQEENAGKTRITAENNLALSESKSEAFMQRRLANEIKR